MTKVPTSRKFLDLTIQRIFGTEALRTRTLIANAIVGQMLPSGVVKGGTSLKFRWGDMDTRFTTDLDTIRNTALSKFEEQMSGLLEIGWHGFTGRLAPRNPATPQGVPGEYVMQPFDVKLSYNTKPWLTVTLEIGHDEIGDTLDPEYAISDDIIQIFRQVGLPDPSPLPCMAIHHQISQKLHGISEKGSIRAHDLIDLQLIARNTDINYMKVRMACVRLFALRKLQPWPTAIVKGEGWDELYGVQKGSLPVLTSVDEAIAWANELIEKIDAAK